MRMKNGIVLMASGLCLLMVLFCSPVMAFDAIQCGDSEYSIYGFFRNNLGMFTQTQEQGGTGNQLATARTWFRTYFDLKFSKQFRLWSVAQFVYEPWYKVEESYPVAENGGPQQHRRAGWKTTASSMTSTMCFARCTSNGSPPRQ